VGGGTAMERKTIGSDESDYRLAHNLRIGEYEHFTIKIGLNLCQRSVLKKSLYLGS